MAPLRQAVKMASSVKRMSDTGSVYILGFCRVLGGGRAYKWVAGSGREV
jgi:hypothetical protein